MYLCISPYTFIDFITSLLKAFNPQLKSFSLIPDVNLAAKLKILEGIFFDNTESYLFFFHPETKS